MSHTVS